ncbi:MAG: hypothetical protein KG075_09565 [Alphaproteobacteria bacterium]|nr:hypothetical protein [Alphaproteobacteria bacterium]
MTVNTTDNRVSYTGNGTIPSVPIPFYFLEDEDLVVVEVVIATGVETVLLLTTDYSVTGAGDPVGGTVTGVATLPSTKRWEIYRDPDMTQEVEHVDNDPLPAASIDQPLDKLTMIAQRTRELTERSLRQPDGDSDTIGSIPAQVARASMYLAFDADGDPIAATAPEGGNVVSAFMATVLDDANAAAARTTLGALGAGDDGTVLTGLLKTGLHSVFVPARAMIPASTSGCADVAQAESTTNKVNDEFLAFDAASIEYAGFHFRAPKSADETAGFTVEFEWSETAGASSHDCVWQVEMQAQGDGDTIDSAWGTAVTVTDTGTSGTRRKAVTATVTLGGSWAEGDVVHVRLSRKATDAADTLNVDARLHGVLLGMTLAAGNDA